MAVVITSYKQVVRAYPTSAGSYVVSKENLATIFGLIAGAALLADYVLTVAVSGRPGCSPSCRRRRGCTRTWCAMSIVCVVLLTLANLRGVRESGCCSPIPTYGFIVSMFALIVVGIVKCIANCPQAAAPPDPVPVRHRRRGRAVRHPALVLVGLVGADGDGGHLERRERVPASPGPQRVPDALAAGGDRGPHDPGDRVPGLADGPDPSATADSVVAEMAKTIFPGSSSGSGGPMFYVIQFFTLLILVLAANTSYQGFPRLSALLARDRLIPASSRTWATGSCTRTACSCWRGSPSC